MVYISMQTYSFPILSLKVGILKLLNIDKLDNWDIVENWDIGQLEYQYFAMIRFMNLDIFKYKDIVLVIYVS